MAGTKNPLRTPSPDRDTSIDTAADVDARVIVFNCECHTYEQVIALFCQYIPGMNSTKAFELAWKIDHEGEAIVFAGSAGTSGRDRRKTGGRGATSGRAIIAAWLFLVFLSSGFG